jgi:hypothetical protein
VNTAHLFLASLGTLGTLGVLGVAGGGPQPSTAFLLIGGAGSESTAGYDDPGLLDDGQTEASARYDFTLDPGAAQLVLVVTNTSPVVPGVPNPLLTELFFNAPAAITGMSLVSQSSSGGQTPAFALAFDDAPGAGNDPNKAGRFGVFGVGLSDTGNIQGTIANPDADTYTVDADKVAIGPVTFTLGLVGDLTGLSATSFTELLSLIPPGSLPSHGVGKFQAGGPNGASAFINEGIPKGGNPCGAGSSIVLGSPCGGTLAVTVPLPGGPSTVSYDGSIPGGVLMIAMSAPGGTPFPFRGCTVFLANPPRLLGTFATDGNGDFQQTFTVPANHGCGDQVVLQAFAFGPQGVGSVEISNGVLVTMGS